MFDHIRNKVKNLPVLPVANSECSPSMETLTLIRKRNREKQIELDSVIEICEDTEESKISQHSIAISSVEPKKDEQSRHHFDNDVIPNFPFSSTTGYSNDAGKLLEHCSSCFLSMHFI